MISFLNAVLDLKCEREIKEITILNPYQPPILKGLRGTIVDVRAVDARGVSFIVEMQVENDLIMISGCCIIHARLMYRK